VEYTIGWPVDERTLAGIEQLREADWGSAVHADGALGRRYYASAGPRRGVQAPGLAGRDNNLETRLPLRRMGLTWAPTLPRRSAVDRG